MLSPWAFYVASVIACDGASAYTIYQGAVERCAGNKKTAFDTLLNVLIELCSNGCVRWVYLNDVTQLPDDKFWCSDPGKLLHTWKENYGYDVTMLKESSLEWLVFSLSDLGGKEIEKSIYDEYDPIMVCWYEAES